MTNSSRSSGRWGRRRSRGGGARRPRPATSPSLSGRPSDGCPSSTCSTSASRGMSGRIGSTSTRPPPARWRSRPIMTVVSSPTSSPNGPVSTDNHSSSCLTVPPAENSPKACPASASRSTPWTSSAPCPVASPAPVSSATHYHSKETKMDTRIDEIAERIYRLSTFVPDIGPTGFTFNQFLIDADEPAIFHTGPRRMFPDVSKAISTLVPLDQLRFVMFGHLEADECGAMNLFLGAAPNAQVAHTAIGCMVSIDDLADRPPTPIAPDGTIDLGGRRIRSIDTPHVPHGWDAHVLYEEITGTLFCGDLLTQVGDGPALTGNDLIGAAMEAEDMFGASCLTPQSAPTVRRLADLEPTTLAIMHGSSYNGDARKALHALADDYQRRLTHAATDNPEGA